MRQFILRHRWASLLVVGLMLFATSGMALSRMTCVISGHSVVALGMLEDCCPEPESAEGAMIAPVCCEFVQAGGDTFPFVPAGAMQFMLQASLPMHFVDLIPAQLAVVSVVHHFDPAPPITGVEILLKHSIFRI